MRMLKIAKFIFLAVGIALLALVLQHTELDELWAEVVRMGIVGILVVLLVYSFDFGADAVSWQFTLPAMPFNGRWIARMYLVRMVGEAYNNITPTASLGGEPVKAWLLKSNWGVPLRDVGASLVISKTTKMFAMVLFVALGVAMLLPRPEFSSSIKIVVSAGLAFLSGSVVAVFSMQHFKLSTWLARRVSSTRFSTRVERMIHGVEDIDRQFAMFYSSHRHRLLMSVIFAYLNFVIGTLEIFLILYFVGYPVTFAEAWVIESIVQVVRIMTFFIPASLGTQEGAFMLAVGALTGVPSAGVTTALVRRFRDLLWIGGGLMLASAYAVNPAAAASAGLPPSLDGGRSNR